MQDFGEFDPATKTFKPLPGEDKPGRFGTLPGRIVGIDEMWRTLQLIVGEYDWTDVHEKLERESVAHFKVLTVEEVLADEQVAHNKILCQQTCDGNGALQVAKPPANFLSTPSSVRRPAPAPGQHNQKVIQMFRLPEPVLEP